eukprot:CAMPEP_0204137342 /NCGR_PEP_ID=MMETSP0361-20130328/17356_1 /ASSEMBLY_ACC=CAM_ASM_000343 /TAXON_ID=268821 /ORGANISM="Scrippsiella Hangoei, Strain SHTV-5" /LENGTH=130 /DNA_ID=CAMNT_0051090999 /DNA_START=31 /DNA_END=424 /DNA_ORIENTATION=-
MAVAQQASCGLRDFTAPQLCSSREAARDPSGPPQELRILFVGDLSIAVLVGILRKFLDSRRNNAAEFFGIEEAIPMEVVALEALRHEFVVGALEALHESDPQILGWALLRLQIRKLLQAELAVTVHIAYL